MRTSRVSECVTLQEAREKNKYALSWTSLGDVPVFIPPRKLSEDWGVLEGTIPGQFGEIRTKERKHCN